jgi:membrane protease subunit (stomatin/prohibitin family)
MKIIDWVAYEPEITGNTRDENLLVWRYPSNELTLGTQLIVNQSQEALFFKGGQALDLFGPGTHTLAADNLPLIQKLVNLPFGGKTPFTAEVYFINKHAKLDLKWGTSDPFRITDPVYHIIVPVRSFGQLGIRVADSRSFVTQMVGTLHDWKADKISNYFKGLVVTQAKNNVAKFMVANKISVMDIASNLDDISKKINETITGEFSRFGIEIVNFFVMSISVPDDDPSVMKIQEIMASRAEFEQLGANYNVKRTFDTLEKAAQNEGGAAGALLSGGLGVGLGVGAGASMGANLGSLLSLPNKNETSQTPTSQSPEERLATLKALLDKGIISQDEFAEKRKKIIEAI